MLLVCKDFDVIAKFERYLIEFFNLTVVYNGVEAISKVTTNAWNHFDVIICSIDLPEFDGFQFCDQATKYIEGSALTTLV